MISVLFMMLSGGNNAFALDYFSGFYVFGDSLSSETVYNRITERPVDSAVNWPSFLRANMFSADDIYENWAVPGYRSWDVFDRIEEYLTIAGTASPDSLYVVWGGINDMSHHADHIADSVDSLIQAGARYVLVPTLHECPARADQIIVGFNQDLVKKLAFLHVDLIMADTFSLLNELYLDPEAYGFNDDPILIDSLHFSLKTSKIIAQYFQSIIEAPQLISILPEFPKSLILSHHLNLMNSINDFSDKDHTDQFSFFASWNKQTLELDESDTSVSADGNHSGLTFGIEYGILENIDAGIALGMINETGDFGNNLGDFQIKSKLLSFYFKFNYKRLVLDAIMTKGSYQFDEINRHVGLGSIKRVCSGNTQADSFGLAMDISMNLLRKDQFEAGPFVGIDSEEINLAGYAEEGQLSTSMFYDGQDIKTMMVHLGLFAKYKREYSFGKMYFFGKFRYESDSQAEERSVRAGLVNFSEISFEMPGYSPEKNAVIITLGVSCDFNRNFSGMISYSLTNSGGMGENSIKVGIRY